MANEIIQLLTLTTLAMTFSLVLVLAVRTPLRRLFGARVAYLAWWLVPFAMLAVLLPAPVREVATLTRGTMMAMGVAPLQALPTDHAAISLPDYRFWLLLLWSCGVVVVALLFQRMQRRYLRALGELSPVGEGVFVSQAAGACPAVLGAWKPRIVLPVDFEIRYPTREGEMVMAHERAHLRRGDAVANLAVVAMRSAYWFNPLLHWASTRFRQDQEMACDAMVLGQFPDRRRSYAEAMLKTQLAVLGLPVGCHWQSSQSLKERILMLKQPLPGRARKRMGLFVLAAALSAGSYGAWALQPASLNRAPAYIGRVLWGNMANVDIRTEQKAEPIDVSGGSMEQDPNGLLRVHMNGVSPLQVNVGKGSASLRFEAQSTNTVSETPVVVWTLYKDGKRIDQGRINLSHAPQVLVVGGAAWGTKSSATLTFLMPVGQTLAGKTSQPLRVDGSGHYLIEDSVLIGDDFKRSGSADLVLHISTTGEVSRVDIEHVSPAGAFTQQEADDLTNSMRFEPRLQDGVAVTTLVRTKVHFAPSNDALTAAPAWFRSAPSGTEVQAVSTAAGIYRP